MELAQCPFCNNKPFLIQDYDDKGQLLLRHYVKCFLCEFTLKVFKTEKEAVDWWNTRPIEDKLEERINALKDRF